MGVGWGGRTGRGGWGELGGCGLTNTHPAAVRIRGVVCLRCLGVSACLQKELNGVGQA